MEKNEELKDYIQPKCRVIEIDCRGIIAGSTGAEGEDPDVDW